MQPRPREGKSKLTKDLGPEQLARLPPIRAPAYGLRRALPARREELVTARPLTQSRHTHATSNATRENVDAAGAAGRLRERLETKTAVRFFVVVRLCAAARFDTVAAV